MPTIEMEPGSSYLESDYSTEPTGSRPLFGNSLLRIPAARERADAAILMGRAFEKVKSLQKKLVCRVITEAGAEFVVEARELSVQWRANEVGARSSFKLEGNLISPTEPPCATVPEGVRRIEVPEGTS